MMDLGCIKQINSIFKRNFEILELIDRVRENLQFEKGKKGAGKGVINSKKRDFVQKDIFCRK